MTQAQAVLDVGFASLLVVHGEPATYTPAGGAASTIQVIFDEAGKVIDPETQIISTRPQARAWSYQVSSPEKARLAVAGVTYNVLEGMVDGLGTTLMPLSRDTQIPIAPSGMVGSLFLGVIPQLDWARNASNNTAVEIWRATGSGASALFTSQAAGVITLQDLTVSSGTTYRYKVRNTNVSGPSPFSNEVSIAVP